MIWMSKDGEPRKNDADSENHREPDPPHGHLGGGWLAGSLAERHDAHEHGAAREQPSAAMSTGGVATASASGSRSQSKRERSAWS